MAIQTNFGIPNTDKVAIAVLAASLHVAAATTPTIETFESKCNRIIDASEILWKIALGNPDEARSQLNKIIKE